MKIAKNTVVTVKYRLTDAQNNLIEDGTQPMVYLHGGYENTLPKIEEELDGKDVGYASTIQIEPEDAFGEYDPELVKMEDRNRLPEPLEVGMQFEGMTEGGDDQSESMIFTVTDIAADKVVLEGRGFGHGVGLCQEGAMRMAKSEHPYTDILHHYYTDVHLVDLSTLDFFREEAPVPDLAGPRPR